MHLPNNYDKITIVCYPGGTGGNFLINCLGLSDDCVFLDTVLAIRQLEGKFSIDDKIQYINEELLISKNTKTWNDLRLGHKNFFGVESDLWLTMFPDLLSIKLDPIVKNVIAQDKNFFYILHNIVALDRIKLLWPRAKIIVFDNYRNFLDNRYNKKLKYNNRLIDYWNTIKDDSWPLMPPRNKKEFEKLPGQIQFELTHNFNFEINRWFDYTTEYDMLWHHSVMEIEEKFKKDIIVWNVDQYYKNSKELVTNVKNIYNFLMIKPIDFLLVSKYFDNWKETIDHIKT